MASSIPDARGLGTARPVLTILGVLLTAVGVGAAFVLGERTPGLAAIAVFVLLMLAGALLGAVSMLLALLRRERWRGVQAIVLLANVGVAVLFGAPFLRKRPVPYVPLGEPAFLALAPAAKRVAAQAIYLAYPASDSPAAQRGYVIGKRDARGVVVSLRPADFSVPVGPGELRLQLLPANGLWSVDRNAEHIQGIADAEWQQAAYLELRVNPGGWAVPTGIADHERRRIGPPRL